MNLVAGADEANEVLAPLRTACDRSPDDPEPVVAALRFLENRFRLDLAAEWTQPAIKRFPAHAYILSSHARVLELAGDHDLAVAYWRRARLADLNADPLEIEVARALMSARRLDDARKCYERAFEHAALIAPGYAAAARAMYGELLLKSGSEAGFERYLARVGTNAGSYVLPGTAAWRGQDPRGTRMLVTHQLGLGDQMLFAAILPRLSELDCRVALTVDTGLEELLAASLPGVDVAVLERPTHADTPAPDDLMRFAEVLKPDMQITLLQLPLLALQLGVEPERLFEPYLRTPVSARVAHAETVRALRAVAGGRTLVGIAWDCLQRNDVANQGAHVAAFGSRRSLPSAVISTFMDAPDIARRYHFVSLLPPKHYAYLNYPLASNLSIVADHLTDFAASAAFIDACDLFVGVDMSATNLACLLGKRTLVLLQFEGEWRFGVEGPRTRWMPTAECYRQHLPGDWTGALCDLRRALLA